MPLSINELYDAIGNLKPNKAPGPDGYTAEFYKRFKYQLAQWLQMFFRSCIDLKEIPDTRKTAKIVVILKPGKVPSLPESYCLISLLNIDCKILTSILAFRLNKILGSYIHMDQSVFLKK